ncbi:MAG: hypothetical protein SVY53_10350, partial [Chloroflexota bacterium]|nr:hypothetical protein [Chloroflexota bacterium]
DASADTSVVGYNVYRDSVLIATSSSTSASDSSLVPSTTYLYAVSAYDSHGHESEPSASIQVTTKSTSAPVISSISGTPSDGQTITLRGAGFGIHDLDLEWLGGAEGAIEQGNLGDVFSKEGWLVDPDSGGFSSSRYDDGQAHSGSEAIRSNIDSTPEQGKWGAGFKYDRGAPISSIYATWWVYTDPAEGEGGQWKMWRLQPYNNYVDCDGEIKSFHWYEENHDHSMFYVMITSDKDDYAQSYPNGNADLRWLDNDDGPNTKQWTRIELYAVESSSPGVRDGTFVYNIHKQTEPVKNLMNWEDDIMSRALGVEDRWQYFTFQNYWGNGNADNADFWIDDIYLQFGTRARVEIGDNPVWAECTHREVQNPTAWSEGSIDITLNQGSFEAGDEVYLFVIDEEGQASAGYPIVIA